MLQEAFAARLALIAACKQTGVFSLDAERLNSIIGAQRFPLVLASLSLLAELVSEKLGLPLDIRSPDYRFC